MQAYTVRKGATGSNVSRHQGTATHVSAGEWPKVGPFWHANFPKSDRTIRVKGDLRYYLAVLLEADPRYREIVATPVKIHGRVDGRWIQAEVDFMAIDGNGGEHYFCVVYRDQLVRSQESASVARKLSAITAWAKRNRKLFAVWPDTLIWRNPVFLLNWVHAVRILAGSGNLIDAELGVRILRAIARTREATIAIMVAMFCNYSEIIVHATILGEVHAGRLCANFREARLSGATRLSLP